MYNYVLRVSDQASSPGQGTADIRPACYDATVQGLLRTSTQLPNVWDNMHATCIPRLPKVVITATAILCMINRPTYAYNGQLTPVQLFTGTYFNPVPNIFPYHSTIPLLYKIPFTLNMTLPPKTNTINFCHNNPHDQTKCQLQNNLWDIQNLIGIQLETENCNLNTSSLLTIRNKRSLTFIGKTFTWCCGFANEDQIHDVVDNEKDMTSQTNDLKDMIAVEHRDLIINTENLNNFSKHVEGLADKVHISLKEMQEEINSFSRTSSSGVEKQLYLITQQTWAYIYYNYYFDNLRHIKEKCLANKLPEILIPKTTLTSDLRKLHNSTFEKNLTLAINPESQLSYYYQLPITRCTFTKDYIIIKLKIPLMKKHYNFKAYNNIPIPLQWQNKLCYITSSRYLLLRGESYTQAINEDDPFCNKLSFPLCLIPRETIASNSDHRCLQHILQGADLNTLRQLCAFTCHPPQPLPQITRLLPNKCLITNVQQDTKITCQDNDQHHTALPQNISGTLEVILPCNCETTLYKRETCNALQPFPRQKVGDDFRSQRGCVSEA